VGGGARGARGLVRVLSADWVVPVDGPPIEDGAVAIGDDGRIEAVGTAAELGEGERYPESVILPGFVNAHTHLEYAVYGGFGDGLPFGPWIALHVERKGRIGIDEMEAIARLGALECLRSGISRMRPKRSRAWLSRNSERIGESWPSRPARAPSNGSSHAWEARR
jgi:cytosine/adenosine deaminase-related metal-dependent hydrolase